MKKYPSIPYTVPEDLGQHCTAFYKYDGSNLRFEWNKKRGWWLFGTRKRLFDRNDTDFGSAIDLFLNTHATGLEKVFRDHKDYKNADAVMVFAEFFGPHSFSGQHDVTWLRDHAKLNIENNDPKRLVLIDINIHKKGILGPRDFLKNFGHLDVAEVVYQGVMDQDFINAVWRGEYPVVEGVIMKGGSGHQFWMRKAKTDAYKHKLVEVFQNDWETHW